MAYLGLLTHASLVAILTGAGALVVQLIPRGRRSHDPARNISHALRSLAGMMMVSGWIALAIVRDRGGLGLMIGLAVAVVAVAAGVRLELRRCESGKGGTPIASMMKRAAVLFFVLTLGAASVTMWGGEASKLGKVLLWSLPVLWIPAAIVWRLHPEAGPVSPAPSVACRATLFAIAITAIVSVPAPLFLRPGAMDSYHSLIAGVWSGVGGTALTLAATAWAATKGDPWRAVLRVGLCLAIAGFCLYVSL